MGIVKVGGALSKTFDMCVIFTCCKLVSLTLISQVFIKLCDDDTYSEANNYIHKKVNKILFAGCDTT